MINSPTFIHSCALSLPIVAAGAAIWGTAGLVMNVLAAGVVVLFNLWVSARLVERFTRAAATGGDPAAVGALVFKQLAILPLALLLIATLGPLAVALGLTVLPMGLVLTGVVSLLQRVDADVVAASSLPLKETRC